MLDARLAGEIEERSIAGQIEFWAKLGRALEPLMRGSEVLALCKANAARPLSTCLESSETTEGRRRVAEYLQSRPFPHYEPAPGLPGFLVRIEANGKHTIGRFINREFQPRKQTPHSRRTVLK